MTHFPTQRKDHAGLMLRDFNRPVSFASIVRVVNQFVREVLCARLPCEVMGIDAAKMAVPAGMSRIIPFSRWRAMDFFTHQSVNGNALSIDSYAAITIGSLVVRPKQTRFRVFMRENNFAQVILSR